ncbi:hypothetical protein MSAN_00512600 [Mycena sanguinolenta]|uniref:Uncharacterized protein n=1 Tax=Mycena sanguinolenta TaxID=230812 RepID=A0A8H6Z9Y8_9AGAR|nr:hypothetical protein MSAN_00512600 [Mycena sanguinolenta]
MRRSTIFTAILLAVSCAVGIPHTSDASFLSARISEDDFHWVDAVSMNGKPFQIGYPTNVTEYSTKRSELEARVLTGYKVNWPLHTNQAVTNVPQLVEYSLEDSSSLLYDYALAVKLTNTGWGADYVFYDATPDRYTLSAFTNGWHTVRYNSDDPRIVEVETDQSF